MKAVLLNGFGGREMLAIGEVPRPSPGENQLLVKVMATSVNRPDIIQRQGHYPPPKGESDILGLEVAGTIEQIGPGVSGWKVGDRIMGLVAGGGYAEYALAYAAHLIPIPDSMSFEQAACICETYITAFLNIFMIGGFQDGESALLHGGGGGVNTAAIQLCQTLTPNAKIVVTASAQKIERVKELGAHLVINYQEQDFAEEIKGYTAGQGVNLILDHVGAKYLAPNMAALAVEGRLVVIGVIGGAKAELNLALMMVKRQRIIGSVLRSRPVAQKGKITAEFANTVVPKLADGTIAPLISATFALDEVAEAHEMMEASKHFGKIVLRVGS
ncbi:MAG: NAD(P)H-quinone oxidoreductase [Nitrospira sp.]|nr:NAD(P)H-quinone oxidoreductase [Nitrospira sp.]